MSPLLSAIARHGYLVVFLIVLAEGIGLPAPAALALVAAGAAAAAHLLSPLACALVAISAMLIGDTSLFFLGRYTGWGLLAALCRFSLNPETCILRSAESFYKRGKLTLIFAKFVPGVNTMAAPLAGSMKMRPVQFLRLDFVGVSLYVLAYGAVGYVFRDFVVQMTRGLQTATRVAGELLIAAFLAFIAYRIVQYRRYRITDVVPRIAVEELAKRLAADQREDAILVDVRSHGYYDPGAARIAGSIRIEPNRLPEELQNLPKDKDIFVYCT